MSISNHVFFLLLFLFDVLMVERKTGQLSLSVDI